MQHCSLISWANRRDIQVDPATWTRQHRTAHNCTVMDCTALHYNGLHCTVLYCTILYYTVLGWNALHCTRLYRTALHWASYYTKLFHQCLHCAKCPTVVWGTGAIRLRPTCPLYSQVQISYMVIDVLVWMYLYWSSVQISISSTIVINFLLLVLCTLFNSWFICVLVFCTAKYKYISWYWSSCTIPLYSQVKVRQ